MTGMPSGKPSLGRPDVEGPDSATVVVTTGDGRTGDHFEFRLAGTSLHATAEGGGTGLTIWGTEPALPPGSYEPSVGVQTRHLSLRMSRVQAELLRDAIARALTGSRHRSRRKSTQASL